ncbi:UNVERIFIED_CONTAM: hypothetical protein Sradi_6731400 [Sesamum radiatum]|uniref:Uncharacterized protein n=1 Tax=Sesamum radiatum TaxID=300843 RepID=A0AAW2JRS8_SESRA
MKDRGKAVETYSNVPDFNYSASEMPCKKHPNSSSVGVCAYCLKDRLEKLVCSECGEQRTFSCSCSDHISSSYRNSGGTMEVGRISFLIPNKVIHIPSPEEKMRGQNKLFCSEAAAAAVWKSRKPRMGFGG